MKLSVNFSLQLIVAGSAKRVRLETLAANIAEALATVRLQTPGFQASLVVMGEVGGQLKQLCEIKKDNLYDAMKSYLPLPAIEFSHPKGKQYITDGPGPNNLLKLANWLVLQA